MSPRAKKRAGRKARTGGPKKPDGAKRPRNAGDVTPVRSLTELMAQALRMETEAAERYAEFADAMEVHNNLKVAAFFRKMAGIEHKHAERIMEQMGWKAMPPLAGKPAWTGLEAPETTPPDEVHYLMVPYHVLQIARLNEQRAMLFFSRLARAATHTAIRKAARELQAEEAEHVDLVEAWMKKVPRPEKNWAADPDPATSTD